MIALIRRVKIIKGKEYLQQYYVQVDVHYHWLQGEGGLIIMTLVAVVCPALGEVVVVGIPVV